MIPNTFNFPSVDHLVEGRDYRIVEWNFADGAPVEKQKPEENAQPDQQNPAPAQNPPSSPQAAPAQPQAAAPSAQPPAAAQAPTQGGMCKPDEKMVFGVCRKAGGQAQGEKDFDPLAKTDQEKTLESEAKKQGSDVKNNKPVMVGNKKYGWAVIGGKPVLVEWGAVAGQKKVGPAQPKVKGASGGPKPLTGAATPKPKQPAAAPKMDTAAKVAELQQAMKVPGLPESAQKALQAAIDLMGA